MDSLFSSLVLVFKPYSWSVTSFIAVQALFVTWVVTLGFRLHKPAWGLYLFDHLRVFLVWSRIILLFFGLYFSVDCFWRGFGVVMVSGNGESHFVTQYALCSMAIFVFFILCYWTMVYGGVILLAGSLWYKCLIAQVWSNSISGAAQEEIFRMKDGRYDLVLTQNSIFHPMILFGSLFLLLGLLEILFTYLGKRNERD